ncbi:site-specific integrase [Cesiribacter andamanensis]|uniref:Site-specific tyrosine recombinase XerD n=1 Tax=Cesiribacter andamanensis AMV16 TaxID=1279009 RepID=M7NBR1_9BACT|nr:site-specific integrase [Cesiribacter andamanensis]EMR04687.1 site-specific tyrosine recombinase XerD [Cesiribacter andamanensis AMV16]
MANVTTDIVLDTRHLHKDGTFAVKLRVTSQRKQKYYPVMVDHGQVSLTQEDWHRVYGQRPRQDYKNLKLAFEAFESRALKIISELPVFTFEGFEKRLSAKGNPDDLFSAFREYEESLRSAGRASTADSYGTAQRSLERYWGKNKLPFDQVSVEFLKKYEEWMLKEGNSTTTVGIYLRYVRTLFNLAIEEGAVKQSQYPFGKRRYEIPAARNVKKALLPADIRKLFLYQPATDSEAKARDLWLFSYLCNGINIRDIANLQYKDLDDGKITFVRAKTRHTTRKNLRPIQVVLLPEALQIIERWGNKPALSDSFVFPILEEGLSAEKELARVKQATKTINTYVKRIAGSLGIGKHVTTYTARHSYSTILKRSGAPIEVISESLGHNNLKTTESYLDSFSDETKRKYASHLTSFLD